MPSGRGSVGRRSYQNLPKEHGCPARGKGLADAPPTARQLAILRFIHRFASERGYPPTFREIADGIGTKSTHGIAEHLVALTRRRLISRAPMLSRAIAITDKGAALL